MGRRVMSALVLVLVTTVGLPWPYRAIPTAPGLTVAVTPTITVQPGTTASITLQLLAPVTNVIPIDAWVRFVDDRRTDHTFSLSLQCQRLCLSAEGGARAGATDVIVRDIPTETFTPLGSASASAHTRSIDVRSTCLGILLREQKHFDLSGPTVIAANPGPGSTIARPGRYLVRLRLYARLRHRGYTGLVRVRPLLRVERFAQACTLPMTGQR